MSGKVTIRGGTVFIASDAVLQSVAIYDAQVVCPTNDNSAEALHQSLHDRAAGNVTIQGCHLISYTDHVERQYRSALAKAKTCSLPSEEPQLGWITHANYLVRKGEE